MYDEWWCTVYLKNVNELSKLHLYKFIANWKLRYAESESNKLEDIIG